MAQAGGIIVPISAGRAEMLLSAADEFGGFPEAVPEFSHSRNAPLVCFLAIGTQSITHLAMGRRGVRASVDQRRLNIQHLTPLARPISKRRLLAAVSARSRPRIAARLKDGGIPPPGAFAAMVEAIRTLAPDSQALLDQFSMARRDRIARIPAEVQTALAYQRETIATALTLAGLDRAELRRWREPGDGERPASFLDGLPQMREHEDMMVISDLTRVPGYDFLANGPHGSVIFDNGKTRLTVVIANHLALEEQLGADLIYFNETYRAFTIVQYKAMEGDDDDGAVYRFPNAQLTLELERMDAHLELLRACAGNDSRDGYRLLENPFFLKLCPRIQFNPDDGSLIKGMYLPLDYWRLIESDDALVGKRGGRLVSYGNVGRYLDNSHFVALVSQAWIGTTIHQSAILETIIRDVMATNRTVTLAIKSDKPPPPEGATTADWTSVTGSDQEEPPLQVQWN